MTLSNRYFLSLLTIALLIRLFSLSSYPLMDTTEARYGEMARLMVETGNWLTPQFDYNVPFWGKPPLFTWISAMGIQTIGLSELGVRLPHWIAGVMTLALVGLFSARQRLNPLLPATVLATCGIFSIASGAVMTDMVLTLSVTLAMTGFYLNWTVPGRKGRLWGYAGFTGLALGLLAKGPVALVLVGLAVVPWLFLHHGFKGAFTEFWRRVPVVKGTGLMLLIALPWYILAEIATPGFLDYFFVGEHFKRFTVSGWEGDLYGSAHDQPRGTIWLYWLLSCAPWSFVLPVLLWKRRNLLRQQSEGENGLVSFLVYWMISPLILFSLAGNILPAYVLPGTPAMGILIAILIRASDKIWFRRTALVVPLTLVAALFYLNLGKAESRSDQVLFETYQEQIPVYYVGKRPFSGQFYSRGRARLLTESDVISAADSFYLIGKEKSVDAVISSNHLTCTNELTAKSGRSRYLCSNQ